MKTLYKIGIGVGVLGLIAAFVGGKKKGGPYTIEQARAKADEEARIQERFLTIDVNDCAALTKVLRQMIAVFKRERRLLSYHAKSRRLPTWYLQFSRENPLSAESQLAMVGFMARMEESPCSDDAATLAAASEFGSALQSFGQWVEQTFGEDPQYAQMIEEAQARMREAMFPPELIP